MGNEFFICVDSPRGDRTTVTKKRQLVARTGRDVVFHKQEFENAFTFLTMMQRVQMHPTFAIVFWKRDDFSLQAIFKKKMLSLYWFQKQ